MYLSSISGVCILLLVFFPFRYVRESMQCRACSHEKAAEASNALEPWGEHGGLKAKEQRDAEAVAPKQREASSSESDTPTHTQSELLL
jgi:hypothetical protein